MAQVGVQQPTNLMEMFSSPSMMLGDIAAQQVNDQTLGNLINRQQASQDMDIQRQKLPFELSQLGLQNQEAEARIPGVRAQSGLLQNNLKVDTDNLGIRTKADAAKKLAEISDSDWTQHMNAIQKAMIDPSPQVRTVANQLYQQLPEMVKLRQQELERRQTQLDVEDLRGKNQRELEQNKYAHGKPGTMSVAMRFNTLIDPIQIDTAARQLLADEALDPDVRKAVEARFEANRPAYNNAMAAKVNAKGAVDPSALTGMPGVQPPQAQPAPGQTPQDTGPVPKLKFNNPNEVKAAYQAGKITKEQARKILLEEHKGFTE